MRVVLCVALCAVMSLSFAGMADAKKKKKKKVSSEVTLVAEPEREYGEFLGYKFNGTITSKKRKCLNNRSVELVNGGSKLDTTATSDTDTGIFVFLTIQDAPGAYVAKAKKTTVGNTVCKKAASDPVVPE